MYEKQRLVTCKIEGGKNTKGLNEDLFCSSASLSDLHFLFRIFPVKKIIIQLNSPRVRPQHCRKGCLNSLIVPFVPSEY